MYSVITCRNSARQGYTALELKQGCRKSMQLCSRRKGGSALDEAQRAVINMKM